MIYKNVSIVAKELKAVIPQEARMLFFVVLGSSQAMLKLNINKILLYCLSPW